MCKAVRVGFTRVQRFRGASANGLTEKLGKRVHLLSSWYSSVEITVETSQVDIIVASVHCVLMFTELSYVFRNHSLFIRFVS